MSLRALPHQPISMMGVIADVCHPEADNRAALLVSPEDRVIVQVGVGRCADAEILVDTTDFRTDWATGGGWGASEGNTCAVAGPGNGGSSLTYLGWNPTPGQLVEVEIDIISIGGSGLRIVVGGAEYIVTAPGVQTFMLVPSDTSFLSIFTVDDSSSACLARFTVYEGNTTIGVVLYSCDGDNLWSASYVGQPWYFTVNGPVMTINFPFSATGILDGCIIMEVRDQCDAYGEQIQSHPIRVITDCDGTIKVRACLDASAFGLVPGYFDARIRGSIGRPRWEQEVKDQRGSDGRWLRTYGDVTSIYTLFIERADITLHEFLAVLPLYDHVYMRGVEWLLGGQGYAPAWAEGYNVTGGATYEMRPRDEYIRRVQCIGEGVGCDPANDPICAVPDIDVLLVPDDGQFLLVVGVASALGFDPGEIQWTLNGVAQTPEPITAIPASYLLATLLPGDIVTVTITNAQEPDCPYTFATEVAPPPEEDFFMWRVLEPDSGGTISVNSDTGYWTLRGEDGSLTVYENTDEPPLNTTGLWMAYASDEFGNPVVGGNLKGISFFNVPLLPIDFTALPGLTSFGIFDCLVPVAPPLSASGLLTELNLQGNQITDAGRPDLSLYPLLESFTIPDNLLTEVVPFATNTVLRAYEIGNNPIASSADVDNFFILAESFGLSTPPIADMRIGGTGPAPVTSASDTARADLITRGYTLFFNT